MKPGIRYWAFKLCFEIPALWTFLPNAKFIHVHFSFTSIENWQITLAWISMDWHFLSILLLGVSPNTHDPQLTSICNGFFE